MACSFVVMLLHSTTLQASDEENPVPNVKIQESSIDPSLWKDKAIILDISSSGNSLLVANGDQAILFDSKTGKKLFTYTGFDGDLTAVGIAENGKSIAASTMGSVRVISANGQNELINSNLNHSNFKPEMLVLFEKAVHTFGSQGNKFIHQGFSWRRNGSGELISISGSYPASDGQLFGIKKIDDDISQNPIYIAAFVRITNQQLGKGMATHFISHQANGGGIVSGLDTLPYSKIELFCMSDSLNRVVYFTHDQHIVHHPLNFTRKEIVGTPVWEGDFKLGEKSTLPELEDRLSETLSPRMLAMSYSGDELTIIDDANDIYMWSLEKNKLLTTYTANEFLKDNESIRWMHYAGNSLTLLIITTEGRLLRVLRKN